MEPVLTTTLKRQSVPAEGTKIGEGGGAALKELDCLLCMVNPHYIETEKIWGSHAPPGPPSSVVPDSSQFINAPSLGVSRKNWESFQVS